MRTKYFRFCLLSSLLLLGVSTFAQMSKTTQTIPLIDREIFFDNPEIAGGQLSPDGQWMSFRKPYKGVMNIWVKKTNEPFDKAKPVTADEKRPISGYFWSYDAKYILFVQDKDGDENYHVYALDPRSPVDKQTGVPASRDLTAGENIRAQIFQVSKKQPNIMMVGLNDRDPSWHDLYQVDISTGERKLIRLNEDRITGWSFDWDEQLRLATRSLEDGSTEMLRVDKDQLTPIYSVGPLESAYPYVFDKDNKRFYFVTNKGEALDKSQLMLMDPMSGKTELVEKDPQDRVDFGGAFFSDISREMIYTVYTDDKPTIYWKNADFEASYKFLKNKFPGKEIGFASSDKTENLWLITVYGDTDPGEVHLFDRAKQTLKFQYRPRPKLPVEFLSPMKAVRYPSSDGLMIPAYLTTPKGQKAEKLPLVVMPHGGPWARDSWGYDSYAQFLANRGYAVLQPNFRGSTGYGKAFLDAGNREWGDKMQDDITWGVQYLVKEGIVDPERVGIMGGSYGGYATLAGVTYTPDLYQAAVSIVGPSNLITLLNSIPPYWEAGRKIFHLRMGDPTTEEGKAQLERQSPLNHVDKIKTPLMVVQGANDPRVKKAESDQIVVAMRDKQLPVEYICAPDEGHGFARPVNNMAFLAATEKFLAKHLGGRYQEGMKEEVAKRLEEITVDIATVTLPQAIDESEIGAVATPVRSLTAATHVYEVNVEVAGQNIPMKLTTEIKQADGNWVITDVSSSAAMGEATDQVILAEQSLLPIKRMVKQGPATIELDYTPEKVSGKMLMGPQEMAIDKSLEKPLFADGAGAPHILATLPLAEGYTTYFQTLELQTQALQLQALSVGAKESVTVPAGTFDAFVVEVKPANGDPGGQTYWIDAQDFRVLQTKTVVPQMGGAVVTAKLQ